ncbi:MAG: ergothioneine biosynthesis protein EgtB [Candidatus Binatia bacterium]
MTRTRHLRSAAEERGEASRAGEALAVRYRRVRDTTESLAAPLSAEDSVVQSMPDASPVKWHLAHTSWFFETFVLERMGNGYAPFQPEFRVLFNSYYNTVGAQHPRPARGLLTRPSLDEVRAYRAHVDRHVSPLLERAEELPTALRDLVTLGIHHEQQHQELVLMDLKHLFAQNPLRPAYRQSAVTRETALEPLRWHRYPGSTVSIGADGSSFAFDNEQPRHRVIVEPFEIGSRLVTNGEFLAFIEDGGYERPELWLSDGWDTVRAQGWRAPLYWEQHEGAWRVMTLGGLRPLRLSEPVCHVSFYEADAFARAAGARLPTEVEWETAAAAAPIEGTFLENQSWQPEPASARTHGDVPSQLYGDVWEWTRSPYVAYPGYRPPAGAIGEYNGKFMCNQLVLRGGSFATPRSHIRTTYRNFFPPQARWQFGGFRLAR